MDYIKIEGTGKVSDRSSIWFQEWEGKAIITASPYIKTPKPSWAIDGGRD